MTDRTVNVTDWARLDQIELAPRRGEKASSQKRSLDAPAAAFDTSKAVYTIGGRATHKGGPFHRYLTVLPPGICNEFSASKRKEFMRSQQDIAKEMALAWDKGHALSSSASLVADLFGPSPELILLGRALLHGPKIFRPTALQCEALENVNVTLHQDEYKQPYPTCIVELPDDHSSNRLVPDATGLFVEQRPEFVYIDTTEGIVSQVIFSSHYAISLRYEGQPTLEDWLNTPIPESTLAADPAEHQMAATVTRLALNFLLLVMDHGCKMVPDDPEAYQRAAEKRDRTGSRKKKKNLTKALENWPHVHLLDQAISLFEREGQPASASDEFARPGTPKRPHWRRGHWRGVACGPHRSERKRMFIPAVLVNEGRLTLDSQITWLSATDG